MTSILEATNHTKTGLFFRRYVLLVVGLLLFLGFVSTAKSQDFPAPAKTLVSDFTQILQPGERQALEQKLLAFEDSTSIQLAVVIMNSTGDYDIADYGDRLAQQWGIGNKKYDNGILLLVAVGDRAVTIRTGYGIEGAVPDVIAYRIIENDIKPAFRQNDYFGGINNAVDALTAHTKGEYKADPKQRNPKGGGGVPIFFIVLVIFIILSLISRGGNNGGGKVINRKGASDLFWWTLLSQLGRGGGGSSGGFGGGGGFGSGGGFGGFGGGGFGGGGASGRW